MYHDNDLYMYIKLTIALLNNYNYDKDDLLLLRFFSIIKIHLFTKQY